MYSSGNADNITTTFGMGFNIVNAPDNEGHIFLSIPYDQSTIALSTFATQIAIPVQNTSSVPKYRQKSSGTWTEWKIL